MCWHRTDALMVVFVYMKSDSTENIFYLCAHLLNHKRYVAGASYELDQ